MDSRFRGNDVAMDNSPGPNPLRFEVRPNQRPGVTTRPMPPDLIESKRQFRLVRARRMADMPLAGLWLTDCRPISARNTAGAFSSLAPAAFPPCGACPANDMASLSPRAGPYFCPNAGQMPAIRAWLTCQLVNCPFMLQSA